MDVDKLNMQEAPLEPLGGQEAPPEDERLLKMQRERERIEWEEQERQKKMEERRKAEQARQEAERRKLYVELENLDYELLALTEYPSDYEVESARRARLTWFVSLGIAAFLFFTSLLNIVGPWVGGIAGGLAFVLWLTHGTGMLQILPSLTRYPELLTKRKKLKRELIEYVRDLEGRQGYICRIYPLVKFNQRLSARKFKRIALMSKEHTLLANMRTLQDTACYHEFLVEALKGYRELLQREKEDDFIDSMELEEDELLEDEVTEAARKKIQAKQKEKAAEEEALMQPDPTLFVSQPSVHSVLTDEEDEPPHQPHASPDHPSQPPQH